MSAPKTVLSLSSKLGEAHAGLQLETSGLQSRRATIVEFVGTGFPFERLKVYEEIISRAKTLIFSVVEADGHEVMQNGGWGPHEETKFESVLNINGPADIRFEDFDADSDYGDLEVEEGEFVVSPDFPETSTYRQKLVIVHDLGVLTAHFALAE